MACQMELTITDPRVLAQRIASLEARVHDLEHRMAATAMVAELAADQSGAGVVGLPRTADRVAQGEVTGTAAQSRATVDDLQGAL